MLYTEHVYAFEIASVILLLAIVAAITLTMRKRPGPQGAGHREAGGRARARTACASSRSSRAKSHDHHDGALPRARGRALQLERGRHLPEPQERHPAPDVHRADAARRQLQLHRVLADARRPRRARCSCSSSSRWRPPKPRSASRSWWCCSATRAASTSTTSIGSRVERGNRLSQHRARPARRRDRRGLVRQAHRPGRGALDHDHRRRDVARAVARRFQAPRARRRRALQRHGLPLGLDGRHLLRGRFPRSTG